jgi:hypothetical protein
MWFLLAWLPQVVLANVPATSHERWAAIGTILAGFLLLFGPAFLWILENNDFSRGTPATRPARAAG